jgi:hypothetical protein
MFWHKWGHQKHFLSEFHDNPRNYPHSIIIAYFPPSERFIARRESTSQGKKEEPIVLLEIVLPFSVVLYQWQRPDIAAEIERAYLEKKLRLLFRKLYADMRREVDRKLICWRI